MKEKVVDSLLYRYGMPDEILLRDMVSDCEQDLKDLLHVAELDDSHDSLLKELVLIKINHDGVEGISSETHSDVSTSYLDDLPKAVKRKIYARRRLVR